MIAIFVNIKMQKMYICRFILYQFIKISSMFVINVTNNLYGQLITGVKSFFFSKNFKDIEITQCLK